MIILPRIVRKVGWDMIHNKNVRDLCGITKYVNTDVEKTKDLE